MPNPGKNESQKDFVSRCIGVVMNEGTAKDSKQAAAICYSKWRESKKEVDMDEKNGYTEVAYFPLGGATTFAELQDTRQAQEAAYKVQDLTYDFQLMIDNIMRSDIEDKSAAIKSLTDEFLGLVDNIPKSKSLWAKVKELFAGKKKEIEPEKIVKDNTFMVWKEDKGYRWLAAYSNKFRDNDNPPEIISDAAHKEFVEAVDKGEWPYPELWLWHVKGSACGRADYVAYDGAFALASGTFDADKQYVAENLSRRDDLLTSHGMPVVEIQRDKEDNSTLSRYRTKEISPLPDYAAANRHTPFTIVKEVDMALPDQKRAFLAEILGEDKAAEVERQLEDKGKELEQKVEFKEETKEEPGQPVAELTPDPVKWVTADEVVEAVAGNLKPILEQLETLRQTVENLGKEMKEMKVDEDEKLKHLVRETPAASLFDRLHSAIGAKETEIDGRSSLAKAGPKEAETASTGPAMVPLINEYMNRQFGGK